MLFFFLKLILVEDCKTQWSVSRPLLGLILLRPHFYETAKEQLTRSLPLHKQMAVRECFAALVVDLDTTLSVQNRDKFTERLSIFKRDVSGWAKSAVESPKRTGLAASQPDGDVMQS